MPVYLLTYLLSYLQNIEMSYLNRKRDIEASLMCSSFLFDVSRLSLICLIDNFR